MGAVSCGCRARGFELALTFRWAAPLRKPVNLLYPAQGPDSGRLITSGVAE